MKSNRTIISENRKNLYYNKYVYKASFYLGGAKWTDFNVYDTFLISIQRVNHEVTGDVKLDRVQNFYAFKYKYKNKVGQRIERNLVCIYFNDFDEEMLTDLDKCGLITINKAEVVPDTIVFEKPIKYKYRIYIKQGCYEYDKRLELYEFIKKHCLHCADVSKPLLNLCYVDKGSRYYAYFHNGFKIDFNDEGLITWFRLIIPNFYGKHFLLISKADKDKYSNTTEFLDGKSN